MLAKLINKIPRDWLVFMYKHTMAGRFANTPEKAYSGAAEVVFILYSVS
ncbi:hypothetical protein P4H61_05375 [Paenibacillus peoriae]|nr:hypothetical protein [Paenibacillus peoriae]MEC0180923.1 hypothetical protein [Paenibacillus peoriae]